MGFWEGVNEEMKRAVEEGWTAVKGNAMAGRLKLRVYALRKESDRLFGGIGRIVYGMAEPPLENPLYRSEIKALVDEIRKIKTEVESIEREMQGIRAAGTKADEKGGGA
jgi:hypothetical protein